MPFWFTNKQRHEKLYDEMRFRDEPGFCCFTHAVGLPYKTPFGYLPWFDYQEQFLELHSKTKYIRVIKATGLGFSEITLYYIAWLAFRDGHRTKPCQIPILTGPRVNIAMDLIDRLYSLITQKMVQLREVIYKTATTITINNCTIEAFPSHTIDTVRALPNPIYIVLDEADFFPYGVDDVDNPLRIVERYILKSNPYIVLISTPNLPNGLFHRMDQEPNSRYTTLRFDYTWGVDKIYDSAQIEAAKRSPSFPREYCLQYGTNIGNIFNDSWVSLALLKGERLRRIPVSHGTKKILGLDPAYSSSQFGITKIEYLKYTADEQYSNTKRVYFSKAYDRAMYEDMLDMCYQFIKGDNIAYVFVDGSQVEFIKSLKARIGEDVDYDNIVQRAKKYNTPLHDYMTVIPIYNQVSGTKLVEDAKYWMGQSKTVAIDANECDQLVSDMRIAQQKENGMLDKNPSTVQLCGTMDSLESFFYALAYFTHV